MYCVCLCLWVRLDIYILHTLANQFHNSPTDCILRIRLSFNYIQSWHCAPHRSGAQPLQKSLEKLLHRRKPPQLHKPRLPKYRLWDFHIKLGISTDCILRIRFSFNYIQSWHCAPHRSGAQPLQKSLEKLLHRRKPPQLHKPRLPKYRLWDFHIKLGISNYSSPCSYATPSYALFAATLFWIRSKKLELSYFLIFPHSYTTFFFCPLWCSG